MPSIKDFNKNKKQAEQQEFDLKDSAADAENKKKTKKRRPHLENETDQKAESHATDSATEDVHQTQAEVVDNSHSTQEENQPNDASEGATVEVRPNENHHEDQQGQEKVVKITDLPGYWGLGAGVVKAAAPKVVDVIENVATEWVNDGNFYNVPVGHPIAQYAVGEALRNAKKVEKKLEEKGVFMMAQIGIDYLKSKLKNK